MPTTLTANDLMTGLIDGTSLCFAFAHSRLVALFTSAVLMMGICTHDYSSERIPRKSDVLTNEQSSFSSILI
jgi:hypothetical protein